MRGHRLVLAVLTTLIAIPAPTLADETGFDAMHAQRREAGKVCMIDHFHYGNGAGKTKPAALAAAAQSWASFTAFEYGSTWASFKKAAGKQISYTKTATGWNADVNARACK
jgi:hypothetical protein